MTPNPSAMARVGRWIVGSVPPGWAFVPDFGLRHGEPNQAGNLHLNNNLHLNQDELLAGTRLEPYIEVQKRMLLRRYDSPQLAGPRPSQLLAEHADESMLLLIRHQPMRGTAVLQLQTYVRVGRWIGIATLTTSLAALPGLRPDYERFVGSLLIAES